MKKHLILASVLLAATALTGCDLSNFTPSNDSTGTYVDDNPIADTAIRIANLTTIFLNEGDEYDLNYFITFEDGSELRIADYTFTSTNTKVITIDEEYVVRAVGSGFAYVNIEGPGLKRMIQQTVWVGSIEGEYVPEKKLGSSGVTLNLNADESFNLTIKEGKYHKEEIAGYTGAGTYALDGLMFLCMNFTTKPTDEVKPLENALSVLDVDVSEIQSNVYGLLQYEEDVGLKASILFHEELITLVNESLA